MDVKEYLSQIKLIDAKLKSIDVNIKQIQTELIELGDVSLTTSWPDGQPRGKKKTDPTAKAAVKLAERYRREHDKLIKELRDYELEQIQTRSLLWSTRMDVIDTISKVTSATCHRLLTMRYVELKTWEQIAVDMHYTYQWVSDGLHDQALEMVEDILSSSE